MIGQQCPDCDAGLRAGACPSCGWRPTADPKPRVEGYACQDCGHATTVKAGALVVDGRFLCRGCRFGRLERARREDPADPAMIRQRVADVVALCDRVARGMRWSPSSGPARIAPRERREAEIEARRAEVLDQAKRLERQG